MGENELKVVYHEEYTEVYTGDPAATAGRMESIRNALAGRFPFVQPVCASEEDLARVHTAQHIACIQRQSWYEKARLAAGGAVKAAELAVQGIPAFGAIRPPGHHASAESCWGFCFFNNIAIAIEKLRQTGKIETALIVDIDLHYGDGTARIFQEIPEVAYFHLPSGSRETQLRALSDHLAKERAYDVIAVSAGFDRHVEDWGGILNTQDYTEIGLKIRTFAEHSCNGRRYGVLEGGYNHQVLGNNVRALLEGMK